ncbi:MAG: SMP-30/gluconolactonase/LRE family protein [Verrucomicrobiaceae bacterium]
MKMPFPALLTLLALALPASAEEGLASILRKESELTQLGTGYRFTEGPVWLPAKKILVFSDIPNRVHMQWDPDEGDSKLRDVEATNGNIVDLEGNLLSCQHAGRNVVRWKADGTHEVLASKYQGKRFNSPNDLAIRSDGSIWFTDPTYGLGGDKAGQEIDGQNVYRIDAKSGAVTLVYAGFDMPNGIVFSPDEERVYISDTGKIGKVRAFDIKEDHTLSDVIFELDVRCDGMCVDVKGNLYTTAEGGIHVFDKTGKKLGVIETPERPANVCFGAVSYDYLYITARTSLYQISLRIPGAKPKAAKW